MIGFLQPTPVINSGEPTVVAAAGMAGEAADDDQITQLTNQK
jgi:hypothetical protein